MTRRRRLFGVAAPLAVLALGGALIGCGDDDDGGDGATTETTAEAATADAIVVDLGALNGSGVSGTATLTPMGERLEVAIDAEGMEPDQIHPQHLHAPDGAVATCPMPDADTDGDGIVTLEEGAPSYGPVRVELETFPTADAEGNVSYVQTLDLPAGIPPLADHALVLHGLSVDGEYVATTPVACAPIG